MNIARERGWMKILIIVFSATGNTSKVAEMLEKALIARTAEVRTLEMNRVDIFTGAGRMREFLEENALPHDCICIGGPVYAGHLQRQVKNIIRALPPPGGKWGKAAIPFVTWGGISSGVALEESARLLGQSGRTPVLGMKIAGRHSLARQYAVKLNDGKPGSEALPFIEELAERIMALDIEAPDSLKDISAQLSYQSMATRILDGFIFNEAGLKPVFHPGTKVRPDRCKGCGLCVERCPVQRRVMVNGRSAEKKRGAGCIHCGECFNCCPSAAITFPAARLERLITNGSMGKGLLACREFPQNIVYPLR